MECGTTWTDAGGSPKVAMADGPPIAFVVDLTQIYTMRPDGTDVPS